MSVLRSRDNPRVKRWARLVADARFRRSERRIIVEGPHLLDAALAQGWKVVELLATEASELTAKAGRAPVLVSESVLKSIVDSETPQGVAAELELRQAPSLPAGDTVFLEGVQDAGNVGALLRSAAAFGIRAAVLDSACADAWSAKTLRAGAGAHFLLQVSQVPRLPAALGTFRGRLLCTVAHGGIALNEANLSGAIGWIFGNEGQGVSAELQAKASLQVRVPTGKGTESLNVAAAAAICFYEKFNRPGAGS